MTNRELFNNEVASLRAALGRLTPPEGTSRGEWLRTLYETYAERFLSDNGRIWTTGTIMIPLSLAPFAVLSSIETLESVHFFVLALASFTVYITWLVIADGHRQFQDKSLAWLTAIQEEIGLTNTGEPKVGEYVLTKFVTVRRMRYLILLMLIIGWIAAYAWWPRIPHAGPDKAKGSSSTASVAVMSATTGVSVEKSDSDPQDTTLTKRQ